jgi:hypothetical protein
VLRRPAPLRDPPFRDPARALAFRVPPRVVPALALVLLRVLLRVLFREAFRAPAPLRDALAFRAPPRELLLRAPPRLLPVLPPRGGIRLLPRACGSQLREMQARTKPLLALRSGGVRRSASLLLTSSFRVDRCFASRSFIDAPSVAAER